MAQNSPLVRSNETLAARVERAAHMAYLQGATEVDIAKAVGIKPVTLRDWKKRSEWAAAVRELRRHQKQLALDRLAVITTKAVTAIEECLRSENDFVKLKAAEWVLERGVRLGDDFGNTVTDVTAGEIQRFVTQVTAKQEARDAD